VKRRLLSLAAAASLATATAGCLVGTSGDLHQGAFAYDCSQRTDVACDGLLGDTTTVPPRIAVGAPFTLQYAEDQAFGAVVDGSVVLVPAAPSILQAVVGGLRFAKPGTSAALGMRGSEVADFIHLHGEAVDHVVVETELGAPVTQVDLPANGSKAIVASPADAAGLALAGAMTYAWSSSDESVVTIEATDDLFGTAGANHATLRAQQPGAATVTVTVTGGSLDIPVTVGGAP